MKNKNSQEKFTQLKFDFRKRPNRTQDSCDVKVINFNSARNEIRAERSKSITQQILRNAKSF